MMDVLSKLRLHFAEHPLSGTPAATEVNTNHILARMCADFKNAVNVSDILAYSHAHNSLTSLINNYRGSLGSKVYAERLLALSREYLKT